ncbi:MAG: hypothetical protein ACU836_10850 [Gammaproteobacteria bacterium]
MAHNHESKVTLGKQVLAGTLATATVTTGGKLMNKASKHPVLVFGLGMIAGFFVYKYRKEIIAGATKTVDAGKDFILHQKENLEDLVAEAKQED